MSDEENPIYLQRKGEDCLKTSCIKCKSKPDYNDAIPYFKEASELYHGNQKWREEIICRMKLANCFKQTKSYYEEGCEYEKIAKIRINQLKVTEDAFIDINNSFHCFCAQKEYNYGFKSLFNFSKDFMQRGEYIYAEKCSKIAFENLNKYYHVICLKKNEEYIEFLYDGIRQYLDILIYNDELNECKKVIDKMIELIKEEDSENKKEISKLNIFKLGIFILEDDNINFKNLFDICEQNENLKCIGKLKRSIDNIDEKLFKDSMVEVNYIYPVSMNKKITQLFKNIKEEKNKQIEPNDVELDFK